MSRDVWHLHPVNLVILLHHAIEAMLPVQGDRRHIVLVELKEAAVSVHELLLNRKILVLIRNQIPPASDL